MGRVLAGNAFQSRLRCSTLSQSDDIFETVCGGCPDICPGCSFGNVQATPTCTLLTEAGMEHATSKGGNTTVKELQIHKGYWRATNTSRDIYKCFNTKACTGGLTGESEYCLPGYEGPCEHVSKMIPPPDCSV